jgi:hypothetical protein
MSPARKANGRAIPRKSLPARLLNEGDTIEFAITLSHNYNTVKSGATTTIREGETVAEAHERLKAYVIAKALETLEEINA